MNAKQEILDILAMMDISADDPDTDRIRATQIRLIDKGEDYEKGED